MKIPRHAILLLWGLAFATNVSALGAEPSKAETDAFNFAQGLYVYRDFKSAIQEFRVFLKKYPDSGKAPEARYRLADAFFQERDFTNAAAAYGEALNKHPNREDSPRAFYNLGRSHYRLEQFEPALTAFRAAKTKGNAQIAEEAAVGVGECLARLKKHPEAIEAYREFIEKYPDSDHRGDVLFALGWTEATLGNHQRAVAVLQQLINEAPGFPDLAKARLALSDSLAALGKFEASAEALKAIEGDEAVKPDVLLRQAWNFFNSNRFDAAAEAFAAFAETYPGHRLAASALFNAGIARYKAEDYAAAVEPLKAAAENSGDPAQAAQARYWLGLAYTTLKQLDQAETTLSPFIDTPEYLTPEQRAGVIWNLAQVRQTRGNRAGAIKLYEHYLASNPGQPGTDAMAYALAVEKDAVGNTAQAADILVKILETTPPGDLRQKALFAVAEFLYRVKQPEKALPYLDELTAPPAKPEPKMIYRHAWALFDCDKFALAEALFGQLAQGDSKFAAEARFIQARALEELKRPADALAVYRQCIRAELADDMKQESFYRLAFLLPGEQQQANLDAYVKQFPEGKFLAEMQLKMGEELFAAGRTPDAEKLYTAAKAAPGASPDVRRAAQYGLAWAALKQERLEAAATMFTELRATQADDEMGRDAALQMAEIACRQERFADAVSLFAGLADDPQHGERATYMLAWTNRKMGNNDKADELFGQVLARWPEGKFAADATLRRAEILNQTGKEAEAIKLLGDMPLEGSPLREDALHARCRAMAATADWKNLLLQAETLRNEFPDAKRRYLATFYLARANQALGIVEKAEEYFLKTIEETDTIEAAKAQFNIGTLRFAEQDYEAAARQFLRVDMLYDYKDVAAKALYHAADAFARAGDKERADMYRKRLKDTYPESEWTSKLPE